MGGQYLGTLSLNSVWASVLESCGLTCKNIGIAVPLYNRSVVTLVVRRRRKAIVHMLRKGDTSWGRNIIVWSSGSSLSQQLKDRIDVNYM